VEDVLGAMSDDLVAGESVKISGFGSLSVRQKGRRIGRNPRTGVEMMIEPRKVLKFLPSLLLKDKVLQISNSGDSE
jgi:integration host factor subunit alpha